MCSVATEKALNSWWFGAEGDGKLTTTSNWMYDERNVTGCNESGSLGSVPGGAKVWSPFQVGEMSDGLGEIALGGSSTMGTGHDGDQLDLEAELKKPNELAYELLAGQWVDRGRVGRYIKEVHGHKESRYTWTSR